MGRLWSVSASQVDTFLKCERAWYEGSILGNRAPQTPSQTKGVEVHASLEHYGKTGEVLPGPHIEIVQVALPHIPYPANDPYWKTLPDGCGLMLEQEIDMLTYAGGPSWKGYMDRVLALPTKGEVWDYKTTSDFRYAKTPEELKHSPQMVSYAKWLADHSDYEEIWVKHLNLRMRGKAMAKLVEAQITRAEIEEEWKKVLQIVARMAKWAELGPQTSDVLPPNTDHCSAYGGCFYKPKCGFGGELFSIRRLDMSGTNSLLETMMKNAAAAGVATPAAAPVDPLAALMGASSAPPPAAAAASAVPTPAPAPSIPTPAPAVATDLSSLLAMATPAAAPAAPVPAAPDAILSPDAASRVSTPAEVGPPPAIPGLVVETPAPTEATSVTPETSETAAPKKTRGRPKKAQAALDAAAQSTAAQMGTAVAADIAKIEAECQQPAVPVADAPSASVPEAPKTDVAPNTPAVDLVPAGAPAAPEISILDADKAFTCGCETLFVDCLPQKGWPKEGGEPVWIDSLMAAFTRLAAASAKVSDYALIRYESKGHLRTAVKLLMSQLPKTVIVTTNTAGSAEFLEVVTPYVKLIFRGIR
jgi:hypothetical protein